MKARKLTKSSPSIWHYLWSMCQTDGEDFVNFFGLLRKHELYQIEVLRPLFNFIVGIFQLSGQNFVRVQSSWRKWVGIQTPHRYQNAKSASKLKVSKSQLTSLWSHSFSQNTNEIFQGFLPWPLKSGLIKKFIIPIMLNNP